MQALREVWTWAMCRLLPTVQERPRTLLHIQLLITLVWRLPPTNSLPSRRKHGSIHGKVVQAVHASKTYTTWLQSVGMCRRYYCFYYAFDAHTGKESNGSGLNTRAVKQNSPRNLQNEVCLVGLDNFFSSPELL